MKVTVTETIEHSADITPEMVEAYLVRLGWSLGQETIFGCWYVKNDRCVWVPRVDKWPCAIATDAMAVVGFVESRQPHEVLYDIVRGT